MITGMKACRGSRRPARGAGRGVVPFAIALAITAAVLYVATGSFIEPAPPPPPAAW